MTEAARSRRDDTRYEPQLAIPGRDAPGRDAPGRDAPASDPLAELARLVGQDDPFRSMFRTPGAAPEADDASGTDVSRHHPGDVPHEVDWQAEHGHAGSEDHAEHGHGDGWLDHEGYPAGATENYHDEAGHLGPEAYDDAHGQPDHHDAAHVDERYYAAEQASHPDDAGLADGRLAPDASSAVILPDDWARGDTGAMPVVDGADRGPAGVASSRRPVAVLAAVLLLTGGGLAASFLAKSPSTPGTPVAAASRGAPTIMAAAGPTKVKVDDPSATAPEDQDAALLNKNGSLSSGPVKIVSSQEQPADLGQLPKADLSEGARPLPAAPPSPFPNPSG